MGQLLGGQTYSDTVILRDQSIRVVALQWLDDDVIGTTLAGQELFSVSGLTREMRYTDLLDSICRLGTITGNLTLYKDGALVDDSALASTPLSDMEGVVAKESVDEQIEVKDLIARQFTKELLLSAGVDVAELKKAGAEIGQLQEFGFNIANLRAGGFSFLELKRYGYSVQDLQGIGYFPQQLWDAEPAERAWD